MARVLETKQSRTIGRCIYCGTVEDELTEEHITPHGLGGRLTLLRASCQPCSRVTGRFERAVLRTMWFAARAAMNTPTYRPKEREKPQRMRIEKAGKTEEIEVLWQDQWKLIELPIFPSPAHIDRRPYQGGIQVISRDVFELSERNE